MSSEERCVEILLDHCDPAARDKSGSTALMLAAERGSERCGQLLLARSDPASTDSAELDALESARTEAGRAAIEPKCTAIKEQAALLSSLPESEAEEDDRESHTL